MLWVGHLFTAPCSTDQPPPPWLGAFLRQRRQPLAKAENSAMRDVQRSASRNVVPQAVMTATNFACNGRSFRSSIRERSHQPSYECMLAIAPFSCQLGVTHAHRDHCDLDHTARSLIRHHRFARSSAIASSQGYGQWALARGSRRLASKSMRGFCHCTAPVLARADRSVGISTH
jgi:hypothetical protein